MIYILKASMLETAVKLIESGYNPDTKIVNKDEPIPLTPDNIKKVYDELRGRI